MIRKYYVVYDELICLRYDMLTYDICEGMLGLYYVIVMIYDMI